MIKKMKVLVIAVIVAIIGCPVMCYADTVTTPYGNSNIVTINPQIGDNYSRTDIIYVPGAGAVAGPEYPNDTTGAGNIDINGTEYTQITTNYGNTGISTITVTPAYSAGVPSDMDAYQTSYLSAPQSYSLTIDPVTGQIVSISQ